MRYSRRLDLAGLRLPRGFRRGRARMPRDDRAGTRITLPSSCSTTHEVRWHQLGALKDRLSYGVLNFFYLLKPRRTVADARRATSELVTAADVLHGSPYPFGSRTEFKIRWRGYRGDSV